MWNVHEWIGRRGGVGPMILKALRPALKVLPIPAVFFLTLPDIDQAWGMHHSWITHSALIPIAAVILDIFAYLG